VGLTKTKGKGCMQITQRLENIFLMDEAHSDVQRSYVIPRFHLSLPRNPYIVLQDSSFVLQNIFVLFSNSKGYSCWNWRPFDTKINEEIILFISHVNGKWQRQGKQYCFFVKSIIFSSLLYHYRRQSRK
jgi:hypothetical protein